MTWYEISEDYGITYAAKTKADVKERTDPFDEMKCHRISSGWYDIGRWFIVRDDVARKMFPHFFGVAGSPLYRSYPDTPLVPLTEADMEEL